MNSLPWADSGNQTYVFSLALRAGHRGPSPEPVGCRRTARATPAARAGRRVPAGGRTGNDRLGGLTRALNSRLRTVRIQTVKAWPIDPLDLRDLKLEVSENVPQG
ncbi:hypothetical protein CMV_018560 [Castanea mollissima]|uniref:Uncharacterized protein n=1 Tax=Castanea mollissima TaxID=60419 RepID=A0A8J4R0T9_9ROSI|nr:hypothetical protein CMV_018560 [Castanea mollissima]